MVVQIDFPIVAIVIVPDEFVARHLRDRAGSDVADGRPVVKKEIVSGFRRLGDGERECQHRECKDSIPTA